MLVSCSNTDENYTSKDIDIRVNEKLESSDTYNLQIDGLYELKKDAYMYESAEKSSKFDKLDKTSTVQVLKEAEDGFVWVDYNGNKGYVEVNLLEEI